VGFGWFGDFIWVFDVGVLIMGFFWFAGLCWDYCLGNGCVFILWLGFVFFLLFFV